ncbi:farnesyl pyrophosphate synthase 1-like [Hibiscus syriacus]|uniref:farnesyl pyrophosphate synthase 1-like n=1 Tax=Hibiscus syriacus TaxID=106335 RepID=UPI00192370A8|nr:farnesyl pyrophosphate synthase 1-like [Hibiscus syriacus]
MSDEEQKEIREIKEKMSKMMDKIFVLTKEKETPAQKERELNEPNLAISGTSDPNQFEEFCKVTIHTNRLSGDPKEIVTTVKDSRDENKSCNQNSSSFKSNFPTSETQDQSNLATDYPIRLIPKYGIEAELEDAKARNKKLMTFLDPVQELIDHKDSLTRKMNNIVYKSMNLHMLEYNVPGGKLNRGLSVIDSYRLLKEGKELIQDEIFLASALGWCIEWVQSYFLVLDDIMDNSHTRRGQPCWFRIPKVGLIAVNDCVLLRNHIDRILKNHFRNELGCILNSLHSKTILNIFTYCFTLVEFQTASGQTIDLITTFEGEKDLSKYSLSKHRRIVQYKTAYYSFYLPVACALVMAGENLDNHIDVKNILVDMGISFQGQLCVISDWADIEDFKCSWLVVKALEICNEEQKIVLYENYGKPDPANIAKVKALYSELNLKGVFEEYESTSYEKLVTSIDGHPSKAVQAVLKSFLIKIYKRQK